MDFVYSKLCPRAHNSVRTVRIGSIRGNMTDLIELSELGGSLMKRRSHSTQDSLLDAPHDGLENMDADAQSSLGTLTSPRWQSTALRKEKIKRFFIVAWEGPIHPIDNPPKPIGCLLWLESLPLVFRQKTTASARRIMLGIYLLIWLAVWTRIQLPYLSQPPEVSGLDTEVISLTCEQSDMFWKGKNAACGLNAENCPSLDTKEDIFIRCPALCDRGSWLYSLRAIGDQVVKYRGYFVGGGETAGNEERLSHPYRADSFPCGAAVHSGIVSPFFGGCARISYSSGAQTYFKDTKGHYGVSDSIKFDTFFPYSFFFKGLSAKVTQCYDPRFPILLLNIFMGMPIVFFGSGVTFFWIMSIVGYWTIAFATDPPVLVDPHDKETFFQLISVGLERFLPTAFVLHFLWVVSVKQTFGSLHDYVKLRISEDEERGPRGENSSNYSTVTRLILWYPFFWLGVLNNVTFDRLPVDRLTWHDLQVQPGALLTVLIVALVLVFCIIAQAYYVWLLGRFWKLILVYGVMFMSLILIANIPGLTLRIHHYIFGLMFIPGCATRGRTAYAFQGILLGFFLSGVSRWGYASIAETDISLLRGEPIGKLKPPEIFSVNAGVVYWNEPSFPDDSDMPSRLLEDYSDISVLINDIERYRGKNIGSLNITQLIENNTDLGDLVRKSMEFLAPGAEIPLYLRIAKYSPQKKSLGDYSSASTLLLPSYNLTIGELGIT